MAATFESVDIRGLRKTHFTQLLSYLKERDREGWYYGNKQQFEQRQEELKLWIEGIVEHANSEGVRIPKKD